MNPSEFLNKVRSTLDASLQQWKFADCYFGEPYFEVKVLFLGTGRTSTIFYCDERGLFAEDDCKDNSWLTDRLNAKKRDEAGVLR